VVGFVECPEWYALLQNRLLNGKTAEPVKEKPLPKPLAKPSETRATESKEP